ncbi:hypothetical protein D1614_19390 [Maribellus luteus]|uniref:Alpha-galactosidase n=1 Tax=Maribellus luteus TaxID=2305463 RepID=A0A399SW73_9BACT|nr:hypothetical protein [Maribellus luteus]RIJ46365.1 hypothetical protein D1614_19390 [Maribellus luteus]
MNKRKIVFVASLFFCGLANAQSNYPSFQKEKVMIQQDWLVETVKAPANMYEGENGQIVFSNGLVSRTFTTSPNGATVGLDLLSKDEAFLRSVRPEAEVEIDGMKFNVGGLLGQPIHNYLLPEWLDQMTADPASFKLVDYSLDETKERFAWKKRPEWMPKDMPWPVPGKELVFRYQLDKQALEVLAAQMQSDDSRPVLFSDGFEKLDNAWLRFESKADERNSFINEGKSGEIMALANTAVYADRVVSAGSSVFLAKINPGTDQSVSWGPGMGLVFGDKVVKINLRIKKNELGFFDGEQEKVLKGLEPDKAVWLRMELKEGKVQASYSYDQKSWTEVGQTAISASDKLEKVRLGKMDWAGKNSDHAEKGERGRCHFEAFQMLGELSDNARLAGKEKFSYLKDIEVKVHYELYDDMPVFSKWITVENKSNRAVQLNTFKSEILAVTEAESVVDSKTKWELPNITVESDYNFGGMSNESIFRTSLAWNVDPLYKTQVNYERVTPCLLEAYPKYGSDQRLETGKTFNSYRIWELLHDSRIQERKGLEHRRMMRALAPWATENPILMHVRSASDEAVKTAVDQCSEVGFEMVIMTFGSGFNAEDNSPENLQRMKKLADYAHSKGIALGGYSLLASRRINAENDVVMPEGMTPRFGNSPCLESEWGQSYFEKMYQLFEQSGLDIFEHDGSYPGDICSSEKHPGHKGLADSQWNQYKRITDFYKWCRGKGIYLNVPDYYFLSGSNKTGMGYRETNWSLPREQQEIVERQNIYDGTWTKTPSMGWMFVPLVEYHGGGEAATIEPLKDHLPHYGQRLANLFGAGVQACYRGPKLYDAPETKELVKKWVDFYKQHRRILDSDIIHIRRADGRDYDAILHVDPQGEEKGLAMFFNPTAEEMVREIELPLYYTGLTDFALIREKEGTAKEYRISRDYKVKITVTIPANSYNWYVIE